VITINPEIAERLNPSSRPRTSQPEAAPQPVYQPQYAPPPQPEPAPAYQAEAVAEEEIDWIAVGLGLMAVLAVGGLIPFWLMVYLTYFPPN
ncbi:MAG: hypothetical protein JNJ72_20305, partial [Anaerolineales bacterium]|nr:hypothetical protein [Anaerolineales bacterium]